MKITEPDSQRLKTWKATALTSKDDYPKAPNMRQLEELDRIVLSMEKTEAALKLAQDTLVEWAKDDLKAKGVFR